MTGPPTSDAALVLDGLTVRSRRAVGCENVSLRVPPGATYALLGRERSGKSSVIRALRGEEKPAAGRAVVGGLDAWKERRAVRRLLGADPATVIVLDEPDLRTAETRGSLERAARRGASTLYTSRDAAGSEGLASRLGILKDGRLVLDDDVTVLRERFRRIRYRNEDTPTRTDYGTELDAFDAVRVRVRGWGSEAIVSNFSDERLAALGAMDGVLDVVAERLTLQEIFDALSPGERP